VIVLFNRYKASRRLRNRFRSYIRRAIFRAAGVLPVGTWSHLPYTPTQLGKHLENQFQEGMTWANWGNKEGCWSIDHIYPKSKLVYDSTSHPNFRICWALKNLRPMWHEDNLAKGASIPDE